MSGPINILVAQTEVTCTNATGRQYLIRISFLLKRENSRLQYSNDYICERMASLKLLHLKSCLLYFCSDKYTWHQWHHRETLFHVDRSNSGRNLFLPLVVWNSSSLRTWPHSTPPPLLPQCPWPSMHYRFQGHCADWPSPRKQNYASAMSSPGLYKSFFYHSADVSTVINKLTEQCPRSHNSPFLIFVINDFI